MTTYSADTTRYHEPRVGWYDHLNRTDPICLPLDLDELARLLVRSNYGVQRFLSALVRARKVDTARAGQPDRLMSEIQRLLEEGEY